MSTLPCNVPGGKGRRVARVRSQNVFRFSLKYVHNWKFFPCYKINKARDVCGKMSETIDICFNLVGKNTFMTETFHLSLFPIMEKEMRCAAVSQRFNDVT